MPDGGAQSEAEAPASKRRFKLRWRQWLRALHRDFGYIAVGLTFIYALSGLAVNHIADWDPSFENFEREYVVETPLPTDDDEAAAVLVQRHAGIAEAPIDVYRVTDDLLELTFEHRTLHVTLSDGKVFEEGQEPRVFLRAANWLHLNRGKKAWTWFADGYAVVLVFLATSGLFMLPGRKGLLGRGAVLVGLGIAIPLVYLSYVGSP
ncbi:PepSY-associated TM helix domain-containing protein [Paraliomyxa miuraensis]|uniref:PepSY-associated TM helix domain-containing protein n=1 Tax=Paraliomyxa miuraensis TaxID=376150 RepID=UPI002252AF32|nr:PepSY-associated TM helix domain-containing protein [Paraliomyxa miuraensis]MCX4243959.1 PepSY-associated TM helix domain-containing protein [Paraliomyxa miuraensis]